MNVPCTRRSSRYSIKGIFGEETVETIRSRDLAWCLAQSLSSSVAMNRVAPIFSASPFFADVLEIATTSSAPSAW